MAINFTDVKEKEEVLETDKSKGIHTPGIVSGHTYTDTNGNERHKYEVLSTYTTGTVNRRLQELNDAAEEPVDEEPADEPTTDPSEL